ncbi:MAG: hypothetical protein J6I69_00410 [Bacilli bacterium]|nr:hypothetical protein [Bacilli bacterium]
MENKLYQAYLYFNYPAFNDILILVINNELTPNRVVSKGDFIGLYYNDELIGVNILNSNQYLKLRLGGLIHNPNKPLSDLISDLVKNYLDENIELVSSPVLLGKVVNIENDSYQIQLDKGSVYKCGIIEKTDLEVNDLVLISPSYTRLENGNLASSYLKKDEKYLIIGQEEGDIDDILLGVETYTLSSKKK